MGRKIAVGLAVIAVLMLTTAGPVLADGPGYADVGQAFGEHVSQMAQGGHLGPVHHPGHHHGITGWPHNNDCQP